ncbi:MAG: hypothetical protein J1E40_05390 [Oscillospiraceae bacterium]|nr:hypothetical protein [Oscillospiraceae bacterium]
MNDKELISVLIDMYTNLQRIQKSDNKDKEIANQIKIVKSKLESFGVVISDIELD